METNTVKLPPNFDLRSQAAATEWRFWRVLFEDYLISTGQDEASDKIKLSLLRNMMGPESSKVIMTFKLSQDEQVYDKVIQCIEAYVNPKYNEVFERYKFNERNQKEHESFENFYTALRQQISTCNYGTTSGEILEDQLLRDRLVQGLRDKHLQEQLLRMESLTLDKVANICRASEVSKSQVKEMNPALEIDAVKHSKKISSRSFNKFNKEKYSTKENQKFLCRRCQQQHGPRECPAYGKKCIKCGILNHLAISCRVRNVNEVKHSESEESEDSNDSVYCGAVQAPNINKGEWIEYIKIEGHNIKCKLDTGADISVMPKKIFDQINTNLNYKLHDTELKVESFVGEKVKPLGLVNLKCKFRENECYENFIIVEYSTMLLGLPACLSLNLVKRVNVVESSSEKEKFIQQYIKVFEGIGRLPGTVDIPTKFTEEQICHPSQRLPSCLLEPLKSELKRLESRNAIVKVNKINENACVNRVVIVEKPNGKVRLCLDPADLNKIIVKKPKILPTLDDLSFKLKGKKFFSVLDLSEGFHHLVLSEKSSWKCCFATPFGVYRYLVLPYGLMNAPELFQDVLENHFGELHNVIIWADDILVMGNTEEQHDKALLSVIKKAQELGIVFNKSKFQYKQTEVKYVGQVFNEQGMCLDKDRIESLISLKEPENRDQLRQILGSFNYVRRYVPDMANLMSVLFKLLKKDSKFIWLPAHRIAFAELKRKICSAPSLTPFDSKKKIILQCDASKSGIGCCLFQQDEKNVLKLVTCASRTMNDAELNYSQTEKELLSICFAVKKFHRFIYGSHIDVQTDHKPIVSIMLKPVCKIGSPRLKRLRLKLLTYHLNVYYVPGKLLHFADMLSRNSLNYTEYDKGMNNVVHSVTVHLPMSSERKFKFINETEKDCILSLLKKYYLEGWPEENKISKECKDYYRIKEDIYFESGLAFYQNKIIVPQTLRSYVINLIHEGHPGICKSINKARQLFYWPGLSKEIREHVLKCRTCEKFRSANSHDKPLPHKIPNRRYAKVGTDILDFCGKYFLVVIDYFSHWLEILPLNDKTSKSVINAFQEIFCRFGLPEEIVADNNPFNSFDCHTYYKSKDIIFTSSSPHYPRSNGMAEKAVHISKSILKKAHEDKVDYRDYLLSYNNTPLTGLEVSPSQILNSRRVRTLIPLKDSLLEPKVERNIYNLLMLKQSIIKDIKRNKNKREVEFNIGDEIVHKTDQEKYWKKGKILAKCKEPRSFWIGREGEGKLRRNIKHIKKSYTGNKYLSSDYFLNDNYYYCEASKAPNNSNVESSLPTNNCKPGNVVTTRSGRLVKPRDILDL